MELVLHLCPLGQVCLGPQDRPLLAHFTDGETCLGHCLNLQSLTSHRCRMPWVNGGSAHLLWVMWPERQGLRLKPRPLWFYISNFSSTPVSWWFKTPVRSLPVNLTALGSGATASGGSGSGPEASKFCVSVDRSLTPLSHSGLWNGQAAPSHFVAGLLWGEKGWWMPRSLSRKMDPLWTWAGVFSQGLLVCHLGLGGGTQTPTGVVQPFSGGEKRGLGGLFLRSLQPLLLLEVIGFCCHGNSGQLLTSLRMITFWQIK